MTECQRILRTKPGSAYVTDDGQQVAPHLLHLYDCACGNPRHNGMGWYTSEQRARRSYERRTRPTGRNQL